MKVIGLTGGIGMGKSTAADLLGRRGLPVIDTDALARAVVEPGQPAFRAILQAFGPEVMGTNGRLRRDELARLVFADEERRKQLEAIVHPPIRERWAAQVEAWRKEGRPGCVVVIPLLFETDAAALFDVILCVGCSAQTQRGRLQARGWSEEQIHQRIRAQWPIEKKMARSHYVIWTEADLEVHAQQIERILAAEGLGPSDSPPDQGAY